MAQMRITVSIAAAASLLGACRVRRGRRERQRTGADLRVVSPTVASSTTSRQYSDTTDDADLRRRGLLRSAAAGEQRAAGTRVQGAERARRRRWRPPRAASRAAAAAAHRRASCRRLRPRRLRHRRLRRPGECFWYTKVNHAGASGGRLASSRSTPATRCSGYLSPNFPPPPELVLNAPVRQPAGAPLAVQVAGLRGRRHGDARAPERWSRAAGRRSRPTPPATRW